MNLSKIPLHLRQLSKLREATLDAMKHGPLSARVATIRRGLRLRDRLLRQHGVDAFDPHTAEVLCRPIAQGDPRAAQLAFDLLRRERTNLRG